MRLWALQAESTALGGPEPGMSMRSSSECCSPEHPVQLSTPLEGTYFVTLSLPLDGPGSMSLTAGSPGLYPGPGSA